MAIDDDEEGRPTTNPLAVTLAQDLDRLSVEELEERITLLETEVLRCRAKIEQATKHRSEADKLFGR